MDTMRIITRSIRTVKRMFQLRGYTQITKPKKVQLETQGLLTVTAKYHNPRSSVARDKALETITCVWIPFNYQKMSASIGKNEIVDICRWCSGEQIHLILIADSVSFKAVEYLNSQDFVWEILTYRSLAFDPTRSMMVPTYHLLDDKEKAAVEATFGPASTYPKIIAKYDAIAVFLDFRVGDVLRVTKYSPIAGKGVSYRLVSAVNHAI